MKLSENVKPISDDASHADESLETKAMLVLVAQGEREMAEGKVQPARAAITAILGRLERSTC